MVQQLSGAVTRGRAEKRRWRSSRGCQHRLATLERTPTTFGALALFPYRVPNWNGRGTPLPFQFWNKVASDFITMGELLAVQYWTYGGKLTKGTDLGASPSGANVVGVIVFQQSASCSNRHLWPAVCGGHAKPHFCGRVRVPGTSTTPKHLHRLGAVTATSALRI